MKKAAVILFSLLGSGLIIYILGPTTSFEEIDPIVKPLSISIDSLEAHISALESKVSTLKDENESRVIWHKGVKKTPYAMVYLHGFSAGVMESDPVHQMLAEKYGCNLYLARLSQHGISDPDAFLTFTPQSLIQSAKDAIAIGQLIGDKVILISCSTGGTASIYLTANNPNLIHAQILYSPNTAIIEPTAVLFNKPWGKQIIRSVIGDFKLADPKWVGTKVEDYWTLDYRIEGLVALQELLEQTMTDETYALINSPYFVGYYYKNEEESDHVISIPGIINFDKQTNTPEELKKLHAFPTVGSHVIASSLQSNDIDVVVEETSRFIERVLKIEPYTSKIDRLDYINETARPDL